MATHQPAQASSSHAPAETSNQGTAAVASETQAVLFSLFSKLLIITDSRSSFLPRISAYQSCIVHFDSRAASSAYATQYEQIFIRKARYPFYAKAKASQGHQFGKIVLKPEIVYHVDQALRTTN
ncbi:hypothetical protein DY000_02039732 [Brassica cretica]|uniref:Uncharacterized protein n=1 Tax=Brassica cretica TaxID=69181 RepID=A0ABQ7BM99_BRACR|nr:hypothetical protein DY000_02039732 [Brassica cretica]